MRGEKFQPLGQTRAELEAEHQRLERQVNQLRRARRAITHDLEWYSKRLFQVNRLLSEHEDGAA